MMETETQWQEFDGALPEALQGLGEAPVFHEDAFWTRVGSAIMVAAAPPASLFPAGARWVGIPSVPDDVIWGPARRVGTWSIRQGMDGMYLRLDNVGNVVKGAQHTWLYQKHVVLPLTLHFAGAPRTLGVATSSTAGSDLQNAATTLLNYLDSNGVPPETTTDSNVAAFQSAWNADPANSTDQLAVDSEYGPLTFGALAAIVGNVAPPVNYGGTPTAPTPGGQPVANASGVGPLPYIIGAVVVAGALAAYTYSRKGRLRRRKR
jgi:hypothetical protein